MSPFNFYYEKKKAFQIFNRLTIYDIFLDTLYRVFIFFLILFNLIIRVLVHIYINYKRARVDQKISIYTQQHIFLFKIMKILYIRSLQLFFYTSLHIYIVYDKTIRILQTIWIGPGEYHIEFVFII